MDNKIEQLIPQKPIWRILRNSSWSISGKALGAVLSVVYLAMITRSLGPIGFGKFALIFSFAQVICGIVSFPTWQIILRYGTKYVLDKRDDEFAQMILLCLAMDIMGVCLGTVLAVVTLYGFGSYFGIDAALRFQIVGFTVILLLSLRNTVIGILRAHDRFRDASLSDSLVPVIRFLGVLLIVYTRPNTAGFLLVWAVSEISATVILWIITLRTIKLPIRIKNIRNIPEYYKKYPDLTRFAVFSNLSSTTRLLSQQFIVLIVGLHAGPAAAGFFRLGQQLGQVLARISDGLSIAIYAEFSRMTHRDGSHAAQTMIGKTIKVTVISAVVILAIVLIAGKSLIVVVFGADFAPAYPLVVLLGGAAAVQLGSTALEPVLMVRGHAGRALLGNMIGATAMLVMLLFLMQRYYAVGASVAVLMGAVTGAIALTYFYRSTKSVAL